MTQARPHHHYCLAATRSHQNVSSLLNFLAAQPCRRLNLVVQGARLERGGEAGATTTRRESRLRAARNRFPTTTSSEISRPISPSLFLLSPLVTVTPAMLPFAASWRGFVLALLAISLMASSAAAAAKEMYDPENEGFMDQMLRVSRASTSRYEPPVHTSRRRGRSPSKSTS